MAMGEVPPLPPISCAEHVWTWASDIRTEELTVIREEIDTQFPFQFLKCSKRKFSIFFLISRLESVLPRYDQLCGKGEVTFLSRDYGQGSNPHKVDKVSALHSRTAPIIGCAPS